MYGVDIDDGVVVEESILPYGDRGVPDGVEGVGASGIGVARGGGGDVEGGVSGVSIQSV